MFINPNRENQLLIEIYKLGWADYGHASNNNYYTNVTHFSAFAQGKHDGNVAHIASDKVVEPPTDAEILKRLGR